MKYYAIVTDDSLYHHGIKGQQHGVRNAEWYPIDAYKAHLRREDKLNNKVKKLEEKAEKYKSKVPSHYLTEFGKAKAEKYTRKALNAEGKAYKIKKKLEKMNYESNEENNDIKNESPLNVSNETQKNSKSVIPEHNSALNVDESVKINAEKAINKSGTPENKAYKERLEEYKNWNPGKYSDEQLKKMAKADASEDTASYIQYLQDCGLSAQKIHEKYGYSIDTIKCAMSW